MCTACNTDKVVLSSSTFGSPQPVTLCVATHSWCLLKVASGDTIDRFPITQRAMVMFVISCQQTVFPEYCPPYGLSIIFNKLSSPSIAHRTDCPSYSTNCLPRVLPTVRIVHQIYPIQTKTSCRNDIQIQIWTNNMVVSFPIGNQLSNLEGSINWQEVYTRSD